MPNDYNYYDVAYFMYNCLILIIILFPDKHLSIDENIQEMKCMMHGVGVSKQTSLQCFTVEVANKVLQYIAESLFQHYRLYEFLFTEEQEGQDNLCEEVVVSAKEEGVVSLFSTESGEYSIAIEKD